MDACPKDVAPMSQIMRLRRIAGSDHHIEDRNNGHRHEAAFVKNIRRNGLLHEADLLPDSYGGKFHPRAVPELISSLPTAAAGLARGKMTPAKILLHPHKAPKEVKKIFDEIEAREQRVELNLYIVGIDDEPDRAPHTDEPTPLVPPVLPASEQSVDEGVERAPETAPVDEAPADKSPTFEAEPEEDA
jgi:succinate dehydrogenase / fumarate reductase iron-sulfur subunit